MARTAISAGRVGVVLAAALCAVAPPLPAPLATLALAITFGWLPGRLASGALRPDLDAGERLLGSAALSPALVAGPAALLMGAGMRAGDCARWLAGALALAATIAAFRPRRARTGSERAPAGAGLALLPAFTWCAIVGAFLAFNPFLPPRSDGWFHAAVVEQVALRGLPVEDPSFAGLRLLYFWGTHVWAALWLGVAPRLSVWTPLVAMNLSGALAVLLAVAALARRLGAGVGGQSLAGAIAVLGASPFAWGWVAARAASGEVRGLDEVRRLVGSGADDALRSLGVGLLHPSLASFADKFLVLTPFGLGLALLALFLVALHDAAESPRASRVAWLAVVTAAVLFTHTVAGLSALAVAGLWVPARGWSAARGGGSWRAVFAVAAAVAVGALAAAPYLLAVTKGKQGGLAPGLSTAAVGSLLLGGALLVPAAIAGITRSWRARPMARDLALAAGVLAALGLLVRLPESNQSKFFSLLFTVLAAPAALGLAGVWRRLARPARVAAAAALALALLPTAALVGWGFAAERGQGADSWHEPPEASRAAWEWLRANTPSDAVVADEGGVREAMVFAARSGLAPGASLERDWGPPQGALAARRLASRELCARDSVSASTARLLLELGREVIVVERRAGAGRDGRVVKTGALEDSLALGPRVGAEYVMLHDGGTLVFHRVVTR